MKKDPLIFLEHILDSIDKIEIFIKGNSKSLFFGNEEKLSDCFSDIIEEEEYKETIKSTKYLLTSSVHSCLESLASGNNPVYFKRYDGGHKIPKRTGPIVNNFISDSFNFFEVNSSEFVKFK